MPPLLILAKVTCLIAEDAENFLDITFSPQTLVVERGTAGFTKVKVKPRRKFPLGPPRAAPFKIFVALQPDVVDGAVVVPGADEQVLSRERRFHKIRALGSGGRGTVGPHRRVLAIARDDVAG